MSIEIFYFKDLTQLQSQVHSFVNAIYTWTYKHRNVVKFANHFCFFCFDLPADGRVTFKENVTDYIITVQMKAPFVNGVLSFLCLVVGFIHFSSLQEFPSSEEVLEAFRILLIITVGLVPFWLGFRFISFFRFKQIRKFIYKRMEFFNDDHKFTDLK